MNDLVMWQDQFLKILIYFFYPRILLENGYHLNSLGVRVIVIRGDHENKKNTNECPIVRWLDTFLFQNS
jgi:hypothetical protein